MRLGDPIRGPVLVHGLSLPCDDNVLVVQTILPRELNAMPSPYFVTKWTQELAGDLCDMIMSCCFSKMIQTA